MTRISWAAVLLLCPGSVFAATSATGMWAVDGDVMGTPVKMTCKLTETDHKLSGSCAGAQDNFTPHTIAGKVKEQNVDLSFQTYVQGTPIAMIMSGVLSEDGQKVNGTLDVEPIGVGGTFTAKRVPDTKQPAPAPVAPVPAASALAAPATAAQSATGSWKIAGDVMGTPVDVTCTLTEKDHEVTGSCKGAANDPTPREASGETKDNTVAWGFGTVYEGTPISVEFSGKMSDDGATISGAMFVPEMQVNGTFAAKRK